MITVNRDDGVVVARIVGDIDMANTGAIHDAIATNVTSEDQGFVIDLSDVTYLDSAGIRLLYQLDERATGRQQQSVVVIPPGAQINRSLEAAGVIGTLKLVATIDDAMDVLTG